MFKATIKRTSIFGRIARQPTNFQYLRHASGWRNENRSDDKIQIKWFILVGCFGTMVYAAIMQRLADQDHSSNVLKKKKTYTDAEWADHVASIKRKVLTFENGEEFFMVPITNHEDKKINDIILKLGGKDNVGVADLNQLIETQLSDPTKKYHILLNQTLETVDNTSRTFKYSFSYKLKPGIFTQIVNDYLIELKKGNERLGRFLILNYPNTIKEAVKFEQNVCISDKLIDLSGDTNDIVEYFETVGKAINYKDLKKLDPKIVDPKDIKHNIGEISLPVDQPVPVIINSLGDETPAEDAPAIKKAQYKLRQLGEPIRIYGETDLDVINRLSELVKKQ